VGGGGFKDAWGLGVPMLFKFIYVVIELSKARVDRLSLLTYWQGDAKKFKEEREVNMNYKFDDREILDPVEVVKSVIADLKSEENLREYLRTMNLQDEGLDIQEVSTGSNCVVCCRHSLATSN
jgi:excinuclease UvrABC helicase subunit UvrB